MVQIQINNMMAIIQILFFSLLCAVVTGRPSVLSVPTPQMEGRVDGNLKLYYMDGTDLTIYYNKLNLDCTMKNLPDKIITKVVATSVNFILYPRINWRGTGVPVSPSEIEKEIDYPMKKLRSIYPEGCPWP